jgi:hypothetical protein
VLSERILMEQLDYDLAFSWFGGLNIDWDWDVTVFSNNRNRLFQIEVKALCLCWRKLVAAASCGLSTSPEATLMDAWASHKSFTREDG